MMFLSQKRNICPFGRAWLQRSQKRWNTKLSVINYHGVMMIISYDRVIFFQEMIDISPLLNGTDRI